jgi:hypothetical protein
MGNLTGIPLSSERRPEHLIVESGARFEAYAHWKNKKQMMAKVTITLPMPKAST